MADLLPPAGSDSGIGDETAPRWVKVLGILTILLLLFVAWHIVVGGHGPGQHLRSSGPTAPTKHQGH